MGKRERRKGNHIFSAVRKTGLFASRESKIFFRSVNKAMREKECRSFLAGKHTISNQVFHWTFYGRREIVRKEERRWTTETTTDRLSWVDHAGVGTWRSRTESCRKSVILRVRFSRMGLDLGDINLGPIMAKGNWKCLLGATELRL